MSQAPGTSNMFSSPGSSDSAFGSAFNVLGAFQQQQAYDVEAGAQKAQAQQALMVATLDAQAKAYQVQQAAGLQQEQYASSGVTMKGTPATVIASTQNRGQQEVNAIVNKGELQSQMMQTQANQDTAAGRNAVIGAVGKAAMTMLPFI